MNEVIAEFEAEMNSYKDLTPKQIAQSLIKEYYEDEKVKENFLSIDSKERFSLISDWLYDILICMQSLRIVSIGKYPVIRARANNATRAAFRAEKLEVLA